MAGIGIVNNPRSRRNQRRPETGGHLRRLVDGEGEVLDAATHEELDHALDRFEASGVDTLGINGGDGTGHVVLTAVVRRWADRPLPRVLLLRGGAMNTVAHGHRLRGTPEAILERHLQRRRAGTPPRLVARDLLRVEGPGAPPGHGFIFGTGAVVAFLDAYYGTGRASPAVAALLLARLVSSAAVGGRFAARITAREPLRVRADGEEWPEDRYLSVLAATVPEIGFGFTPFARCDEQPGFFHAVGVTGTAAQLVPRIPAIYAGRPWRRSIATEAVTRDLRIEGTGPVRFTLDGDLYAYDREVRVSTGPAVELLVG
jgi:diacylglycerol kinase family enzyme